MVRSIVKLVTIWLQITNFLSHNLHMEARLINFCSRSFLIRCIFYILTNEPFVTKSTHCDKMTADHNLFITYSSYGSHNYQLLLKIFFYLIHSLNCDEMNTLWRNDCRLLTFYYIFFIWKPELPTFVKDFFWFNA